ncbi:MAG: glycosyltransferase family 4 protein [Saprospiraceae bacterium]|nr:glycosyltransferase family 4 protein [Saprospiraceae bacterium]
MKILMLADNMEIGGTQRRLMELLKGLKLKTSYSVELIVFSTKIEFDELHDLKIPIHILSRKWKKDVSIFPRLFKLCRRIKPDIIHNWGSMAAIYAMPVCWFQPVLFINAIITDAPIFTNPFDQRLMRLKLTAPSSDLILANCKAGLDAYKVPVHKGKHIYNGFDFGRISLCNDPIKTRTKYNIPDKKIIGMVGVFAPRKDYDMFFQLAQEILSQRNDVVFIAVGDGPLLEEYKSKIQTQFRKNIIFTGAISDVEDVIQLMDIGILISNSKIHGEGISNAILEYMAAGKPVIANDNGGNAEIIIDGVTGFIIDDDDKPGWIKCIHQLLDNPKTAKLMGDKGKKHIEDKFDIDRMVDSYIEVYENLSLKNKTG